jgi:hypothetical protein
MYWLALGLAGSCLIASVATLYLVWSVRRTTLRAEQTGEERLEILREQQQRLEFMREERHALEKELELRSSMTAGEDGPLERDLRQESNGRSGPGSPETELSS